jgi:hypothetical protein
MVSIEVVTEPLGAEVTWDGEIKGISPIIIEVELPKTINDFKDECIGKCGKVGKHMYLPVCAWEILKGWLESGIVGNGWWDLTDDQRWCVAYKTASIQSSDEISKYNLPLYDVTIEPGAAATSAIQIKENITNIDGWLFFSPEEPDITPGESDIIPIGSTISIFDGVGDKIVEIDLAYMLLAILRDECLRDGEVVCSWGVLKARLEDQTVSRLWWDLTRDERYSIAYIATSNVLNYQISIRASVMDNDDSGVKEPSKCWCTCNSIIRYIKFAGGTIPERKCYYKRFSDDIDWIEYTDTISYGLPCYMVSAVDHTMIAIRLEEQLSSINDLFIFQYSTIDIQPGDVQLPNICTVRVYVPLWFASCGSYGHDGPITTFSIGDAT